MTTMTDLDRALQRLMRKYPPKHPDRKKMREYERQRTNVQPIVHDANGWSPETGQVVSRTVDWKKQERIPVGQLDTSLWAPPPPRGQVVRSGKGRGNKGPKNSK